MALKFMDLDSKIDLFVFHEHEYPESLPWNKVTKLNKIKYPESHWTNQIIGTYLDEMEFNGTFFGSYFDGTDNKSAKERSDEIEKLLGKVVTIHYAIGGFAGYKATVIIEEYKRNIKNYYEVDYSLKLVPHEPQTRVVPTKALDISIPSIFSRATNAMNRARNTIKSVKQTTSAAKKVVKVEDKTSKAAVKPTRNKPGLDKTVQEFGRRIEEKFSPQKPEVKQPTKQPRNKQ